MSARLANPFQLDVDRKDPAKKDMDTAPAFVEIYDPHQKQAAEQSHRWSVVTRIASGSACAITYSQLAEAGPRESFYAAELSHQTNTLPEVCGRLSSDRLCEGVTPMMVSACNHWQLREIHHRYCTGDGWRPD